MSKSEMFLNSKEEQEVINAIQLAEQNTSGEIRVHIERGSKNDAFDRAKEVFHLLEMDNTKLQNGVLIYLDIKNKTFAICGDKGINDVVSPDFWDSTKNIMQSHFKQNQFKQGLIEGILKAGEQLKKHFPWQKNDLNELSDDISTS
jgi:uncharacterized membrane protein